MFKGSITALITPFKNGEVDEEGSSPSSIGKLMKVRMALCRLARQANRRR